MCITSLKPPNVPVAVLLFIPLCMTRGRWRENISRSVINPWRGSPDPSISKGLVSINSCHFHWEAYLDLRTNLIVTEIFEYLVSYPPNKSLV